MDLGRTKGAADVGVITHLFRKICANKKSKIMICTIRMSHWRHRATESAEFKHESDTIVFSGEECNKSFPKNWKLMLHMWRVHGGKTFVWNICNYFSENYQLIRIQFMMHKNKNHSNVKFVTTVVHKPQGWETSWSSTWRNINKVHYYMLIKNIIIFNHKILRGRFCFGILM